MERKTIEQTAVSKRWIRRLAKSKRLLAAADLPVAIVAQNNVRLTPDDNRKNEA
jgi:hypothetical protein